MALTMIVTRDVEMRYRGFLTSLMLEVSPGVYVAPDLSAAVRDRVWHVMSDWWHSLGNGSVTLVWRDTSAPGKLRIETLGEPPKNHRGCGWRSARQTKVTRHTFASLLFDIVGISRH